jgi:hypothetical protein
MSVVFLLSVPSPKGRGWLASAHAHFPPLPGGEGGSRSETGEGLLPSVRGPFQGGLLDPRRKLFRRFEHQSVRYLHYTNPQFLEELLSGAVAPRLARLRVNTALEFHCEALLKAIEIDDAVFDGDLTAELEAATAAVPKQLPSDFFGRSLATSQFTNGVSADRHPWTNPSPALARCPLPSGEGGVSFCRSYRSVPRMGRKIAALPSISPSERRVCCRRLSYPRSPAIR